MKTPAFFPVGTYGAVRGISPDELRSVGVQGVLANTYHLHLRPGDERVAELGGLHRFMAWSGPMLTDSGGFQIHSLDHLCRKSEKGVEFRDPRDGSRHFLSPERCIEIQQNLGADLIVVLDEFEPIAAEAGDAARTSSRDMLERTLRWAARCRAVHAREDQRLFGIVQGGGFDELRAESAERTAELGFDAFAIGGLGLGEDLAQRLALTAAALTRLPSESPRYLMGLGLPEDLIGGVELGVDLFDCVIPTRHGRHGSVFTSRGSLNLRNARFKDDPEPISTDCGCPVCTQYTRAYLRHLVHSGEALGARLLSLHNLAFYMDLMQQMREAIAADHFASWAEAWRKNYRA